MTRPCLFGTLTLLALLPACTEAPAPMPVLTPGEGYVQLPEGRMWYQVVGEGAQTPLLLVHGGPGVNSHYLTPLAALADERPVIFYDQLGSGRSDATTDSTLWTEAAFVAQLDALREHLGLERFHLLGHSWGSMLGTQYYFAHPDRVETLILSSPALSAFEFMTDARALLTTLPDSVQRVIATHEAAGTYESPEYQDAVMEFYRLYLSRSDPWSQHLDSAFATMNAAIYGYMWGPSEFAATGTLEDFDVTDSLSLVTVPTLFVVGEYDETIPATVGRHAALVSGSEFTVIPGAAHLTMLDNPEENIRVVREFLRRVER